MRTNLIPATITKKSWHFNRGVFWVDFSITLFMEQIRTYCIESKVWYPELSSCITKEKHFLLLLSFLKSYSVSLYNFLPQDYLQLSKLRLYWVPATPWLYEFALRVTGLCCYSSACNRFMQSSNSEKKIRPWNWEFGQRNPLSVWVWLFTELSRRL